MNKAILNLTNKAKIGTAAALLALGLCLTPAALAQGAKETSRYAVVDMQAVILNVPEGKEARAKLEKEIKDKEKELQAAKAELDKMNNEWKSQAAVLSEAARAKKQQEFQEKFLDLRNKEMTFQKEIKEKEQAATQKIAVAVTKQVNELAKQRGYEMVFETSSAGLLYLKDPYDMTKEVIDAYAKGSKKETPKK
jgi:outer membrane protein